MRAKRREFYTLPYKSSGKAKGWKFETNLLLSNMNHLLVGDIAKNFKIVLQKQTLICLNILCCAFF